MGKYTDEELKAGRWFNGGYTLMISDLFEEAIEAFNEAIDLDPNFFNGLWFLLTISPFSLIIVQEDLQKIKMACWYILGSLFLGYLTSCSVANE